MAAACESGKSRRKTLAINSLLKEANEFMKSCTETMDVDSTSPVDGRRRSSRRTSHAPKGNFSAHLNQNYNCESNTSSPTMSLLSMDESVTSQDRNGELQIEMESLEIKPRKPPKRKVSSNRTRKELIDVGKVSSCTTSPEAEVQNNKSQFHDVCKMEVTENTDEHLKDLYLNRNFIMPENNGLETIDECQEENDDEVDCSPVKKKRAKGPSAKKKIKVKRPWRFIPHLVVNPPEIWWQEVPLKQQAECRKKARDAGYKPSSKKRLMEAEKRVKSAIDQIDRHFSSKKADSSDQEMDDPACNGVGNSTYYFSGQQTTFNNLHVGSRNCTTSDLLCSHSR